MIQNLSKILCLLIVAIFALNGFAADDISIQSLRDIKGPVLFPPNYLYPILLILALIAVGAYVLMKVLRAKEEEVEEVPVDQRMPWEIANEEFDSLEKSSLLEDGQFKAYYSQLSGIIRSYFENRFTIKAPEMTTEEFLWSLDKSDHLTSSQNDTLKQFLNSCDIVKFAKYIPHMEEGKESIQLARKLVEETKAVADEADSVSGK